MVKTVKLAYNGGIYMGTVLNCLSRSAANRSLYIATKGQQNTHNYYAVLWAARKALQNGASYRQAARLAHTKA